MRKRRHGKRGDGVNSEQTIYYNDELNDDFAATHGKIKTKPVTEKYRYIHKSPLWHLWSFALYRFVATPVGYLYLKLRFGLHIKNKKAVSKVKGGFFLYGNHTQSIADAFIPTIASFPKKTNVIVSADAVSIPVVNRLVAMLGGIPLASTLHGKGKFIKAIKAKAEAGQVIALYPEAHIWPYYNGIRPFSEAAFAYPFRYGIPAIGFTVTYRQRKVMKKLPPLITVTLSDPIYPEMCADKKDMRDRIYGFMCDTVERENSFAYIRYEKRMDVDNDNNDSL